MEFFSSSFFLYLTIAIGLLFVLFWMFTRKNLQKLGVETNSKLDIIQNSFLIIGLVLSLLSVGLLTCHGQSKLDSYTLSEMVYLITFFTLALFTFIASLVAIADDALKEKTGETEERKDARKTFKTWLTTFSVISGIFVGICITYFVLQLRKKGVFSPSYGGSMSPVDGATMSPVDGLTLSPVDGTTMSPVDGLTLSPVDGTTMSPVDGLVDGITMSPTFGFDFQF